MTEEIIDKEAERNAAIQNTFNTVAQGYGKGGCRFFHAAGENMAEQFELSGDEHILDVASGTGAAAIPLARRLPRGKVTAVDFSAGMLGQSQLTALEQGLGNIEYSLQDMTAMPFAERSFDHANCAFGLFFVEDMDALLAHIAGKVKTGGQVQISGFCGDSFQPLAELCINRMRAYGVDVPEQPFSWKRMAEPHQLQTLFEQAGLRDVQVERKSLGYYTDAEGWWEVIWNAGFRGLVQQLGDKLEDYRREHLEEVQALADEQGLWLEVDVNFTRATV